MVLFLHWEGLKRAGVLGAYSKRRNVSIDDASIKKKKMMNVQRANIELGMHAGRGSVRRKRKRCSRHIATILVTLVGTVLIFSASSMHVGFFELAS